MRPAGSFAESGACEEGIAMGEKVTAADAGAAAITNEAGDREVALGGPDTAQVAGEPVNTSAEGDYGTPATNPPTGRHLPIADANPGAGEKTFYESRSNTAKDAPAPKEIA